ncbi:hypothetical protein O9X98_06600 [Agrobacterium salinitolerans]|nr:hypothetical protein [Agrobacterium salinitolerans]
MTKPNFTSVKEVNEYYEARRAKRMRDFEIFSLFIVLLIGGFPLLLVGGSMVADLFAKFGW